MLKEHPRHLLESGSIEIMVYSYMDNKLRKLLTSRHSRKEFLRAVKKNKTF